MKRITTLLMLLCVAMIGYAQNTYTVAFDGADNQTVEGWFTFTGNHSFHTKYTGTYDGVGYAKGLKLESSSEISFTTEAKSKVILVQSLASNGTNYFGFDKNYLSVADRVDDATNNVGVYTLNDVAAGTHTVTRGTGETGILFIRVEEEASNTVRLEAPDITADETTGTVTLSTVDNATALMYTTDGSTPAADNGTAYDGPFTVDDGTTVKAIALGDGVNYSDSHVSTLLVLLNSVAPEAPASVVYNGTVMLTTTTTDATLEYSLDGNTYLPYVVPFTLDADATVYARSERNGKVSEAVAIEVSAVSKPTGTTTVILSGTTMSGSTNSVTFSDAPGYTLAITGNESKSYATSSPININGEEYATIKLSNGAQNTLTLPEGVVAKRITFYSFVNADTGEAGWKEVGGESYESGDGNYKNIPMGAFKRLANLADYPDVRVYAVNGNEITFTNGGKQLCFVIAIDVAEASNETLTVAPSGYTTYTAGYDVDYSANELTAYAIKYDAAENKIAYHPITGVVPANTAVLVVGTPSKAYTLTQADGTADAIDTDLKAADGTVTANGTIYGFATVDGVSGFYRVKSGDVIPVKKGYLVIAAANAKTFYAVDETTGIAGIEKSDIASDTPRYNLAGQRVDASYKGIVIQNGHKYINK
jgi:hypothetical protein